MPRTTKDGKRTPAQIVKRRKLFKAALAHGGWHVKDFAAKIGVTHSHINYVVRGERTSPWVEKCVSDLIRAELGRKA